MKKLISVLVCIALVILLVVAFGEETDEILTLNGNGQREEAFVIDQTMLPCQFRYELKESMYNKSGILYFSFDVPESGDFYITITPDEIQMDVVVYNLKGDKIYEGTDIQAGETYTAHIEVTKGDTLAIAVGSRVSGRTQNGIVSFCYNDHHLVGDYTEVLTEPTCVKVGEMGYFCDICKQPVRFESIPAKGHTPGNETILEEANCLHTGLKGIMCTVCGEVLEREILPKTDHVHGEFITTKEPTCTDKGVMEQQCTICGETLETVTIPAKGHVAGEFVVMKEATCTEEGLKVQKCTACGEILKSESIPMTDHKYGKWEIVTAPTKDAEGVQMRVCEDCGFAQYASIEKIK